MFDRVAGVHPVLGVDCFVGNLETASRAIVDRAQSNMGGTVCLANVHVVVTAQKDPELRRALESSWLVLPDGAPVAWAQRSAGARGERIAGADLMRSVVERGAVAGLRHFLFGSSPTVLTALESELQKLVPEAHVVGSYSPPISQENSPASLEQIASAQPDVVWVALGAPKQEIWAERHSQALKPAVLISVGAAFDFHAGTKRRAPVWMQRAGLEWLHRLGSEPRRLMWRYISTNTAFVWLLLSRIVRKAAHS